MNGVLVIDKPTGITSYDVIRGAKEVLDIRKIGHTGTLDPLASGVLPICFNEATKLAYFFSQSDKEYTCCMLLGVETDTFDIEGNIIAQNNVHDFTEDVIRDVIQGFVGMIEQKPPKYSAVKFKGKPLYKWTRKGIDIEPKPRVVEIYSIKIEKVAVPNVFFTVSCSKGTYIRSLCADIGERLGCGACLSGLRRTKSGHFIESAAVSIEGFSYQKRKQIIEENLISMVDALPDFTSVSIDTEFADKIRNGYQPEAGSLNCRDFSSLASGDMIKFVTQEKQLVAVAQMLLSYEQFDIIDKKEQAVKIVRVFNN